MTMTMVYKIDNTGDIVEHAIYSLEPDEAVLAAWRQDQGDYNTWTYDKFKDHVKKDKFGYICGNFWAQFTTSFITVNV